MRFAINTPNFGHYSDPRLMMEMAREAEDAGWDGFFIWDHMLWTWPENYPVADPYVLLAAMAAATTTIKLAPLVTPIPRRRPWKLAREVITLDHLSQGRFILGAGIGGDWFGDYSKFGEQPDQKAHGEMLDEGLDVLSGLWSGEPFSYEGQHYQIKDAQFLPKPVQQPRVPVWVAGMWPNKKPFRRAARWDGVFPLRTDDQTLTPDDHRSINAYILEHRNSSDPFDHVHAGWMERKDVGREAEMVAEYGDAGVTWWSDGVGPEEPLEQARGRIRLGPPRL